MRALVAGGSIGGLFTALLLRQRGWDVRVFDRVTTPLSGRGAGIVTHDRLWQILERLGLDPYNNFGVPVQQRITLDRQGRLIGSFDCPQVMTSWDHMFTLLRDAWDGPYTLGAELLHAATTGNTVQARFSNGETMDADLLVGADGIRSTLRTLVCPGITPRYAGYVAWRGLIPIADVPPDLRDCFAFCLPDGEQILGYPVAGEGNDLRPGHHRYNIVWYRPADEVTALPDLLTDVTGHTHAGSIPPPLIRPAVIAAMRQDAEAVLAPQFAAVIRATAQPFLQPIYDLESTALAAGRIALAGDSAFVARPHVGAGVTKAAEDAMALAQALDTAPDVPAALRAYEATRLPAGQRIIARARHLGAYMQAQLTTEDERQAAQRHRTPEAVMAETALLNF